MIVSINAKSIECSWTKSVWTRTAWCWILQKASNKFKPQLKSNHCRSIWFFLSIQCSPCVWFTFSNGIRFPFCLNISQTHPIEGVKKSIMKGILISNICLKSLFQKYGVWSRPFLFVRFVQCLYAVIEMLRTMESLNAICNVNEWDCRGLYQSGEYLKNIFIMKSRWAYFLFNNGLNKLNTHAINV